jgi:pimeloyl-ACP methyl ester carboxylesterase
LSAVACVLVVFGASSASAAIPVFSGGQAVHDIYVAGVVTGTSTNGTSVQFTASGSPFTGISFFGGSGWQFSAVSGSGWTCALTPTNGGANCTSTISTTVYTLNTVISGPPPTIVEGEVGYADGSTRTFTAFVAGPPGTVPTPQELTITVSDGTQLACELTVPVGSPPAGGWPGLLLIPGFGLAPASWQRVETEIFAPAGFASLACDARGTGASGGNFDFDGARDVQDARDLFDWLAARPDISDTEIGAFGVGLGGAEVWNAAVAGVPFKAIVPGLTWTSLQQALTPDGVIKTNLLDYLIHAVSPLSNWDPTLTQAGQDLRHGRLTNAVRHALKERSPLSRLHSLTVPTLIIQARHDLWFDLDQARAAYKRLAGPKRLYIGPPKRALAEVVGWFEAYLGNGPPLGGGVELAHAPGSGATSFPGLPQTRSVVVNLPGTKRLPSGVLYRSGSLPRGTLETFGDGFLTVRYSGASSAWTQLTASVLVYGSTNPITEGAAPITEPSGVVRIPLMDTAVLLRGLSLTIRLGPTIPQGVFNGTPPPHAQRRITIGRVTVHLSVLTHAVSQ